MEILLHYGWLFIKGDVIIGELEIFDVEVFLHYSQFFIKGNFEIDGVECTIRPPLMLWTNWHVKTKRVSDKPKLPWFNDNLACEIRKRKCLEKIWHKTNINNYHWFYTQCHKVSNMLSFAEKDFYKTSPNENKYNYGLPKFHKPDTPLRPIVSSCGSVTYGVVKELAKILKPLVGKSPHHINRTLLNRPGSSNWNLENVSVPMMCLPCSPLSP